MVFAFFFWTFAPCSLCLALLLPQLLGSSLSAEVPSLVLLTKSRLAETAPLAIWHLPLLTVTAGLSPQSVVELHLPHKSTDSCHSPIPSKTTSQDATQGSSYQASFCPGSNVVLVEGPLLHDDLTSEDREENMPPWHSGVVSRLSLTSDDSSSHPLSHASLSHVPFSPQFPSRPPVPPGPSPVCSQTNQTRTQNISLQ